MSSRMRIGELAAGAGVTPRTIRYYESLGLLKPSEREGKGFRYYTEVELVRLQQIDTLKQLGLSLEEIVALVQLYDEDPSGIRGKQHMLEILQRHLREANDKIAQLQRFRAEIEANIATVQHFITQAAQHE